MRAGPGSERAAAMNWLLMLAAGMGVAAGALLLLSGRSGIAERIAERVTHTRRQTVAPVDAGRRAGGASPILGGPFAVFHKWLLLADWRPQPRHVALIGVAIAAIVAAARAFAGIEAAAGALALSLLAGTKVVQMAAVRNQARFRQNLPTFVERMRTLLASGSSLMVAFDRALQYAHPTVRTYLMPTSTRMSLGAGFADSLRVQAERLGNADIEMLAMIAQANLRYGGSLGDILDRLVKTLRGQIQVQKEFDALTSETRSSAKVLFALPLVVSGVIFSSQPSYIEFFVDDPTGQKLLVYAVVSNILGMLVLRRLSNLEA